MTLVACALQPGKWTRGNEERPSRPKPVLIFVAAVAIRDPHRSGILMPSTAVMPELIMCQRASASEVLPGAVQRPHQLRIG